MRRMWMVVFTFVPTLAAAQDFTGFEIPAHRWYSIQGSLSGSAGPIPTRGLSNRDIRITSFFVGSRADFEQMNRFIEGHRIRPIIDRVFEFEQAAEAFDFIENGDFMGKVVIRL